MKNLLFLYAAFNKNYAFDNCFDGKNAFEKSLDVCKNLEHEKIVVATNNFSVSHVKESISTLNLSNVDLISDENWTVSSLLEKISGEASKNDCSNIVFVIADKPFLNTELCNSILQNHIENLAEYTYCDGYPKGFGVEVLASGTANILNSICKETHKEFMNKNITEDFLFDVIKTDVNAFEIEALLAEKDFRMLRFDFSCSNNQKFVTCKNLFNQIKSENIKETPFDLSEFATKSEKVQCSVPAFYNIQICQNLSSAPIYSLYAKEFQKKYNTAPFVSVNKNQDMKLEDFNQLLQKISDFSKEAVISLSLFGDCLLHQNVLDFIFSVLSYPEFSLLIETEGQNISSDFIKNVKEFCEKTGNNKIDFIVSVDAVSKAKYDEIHLNQQSENSFENAVNAVALLTQSFENHVYPQFVRMKENENELENFWRFYHESESPSKGKVLIEKYDFYCGKLEQRKTADLSPLERFPCWHLKRDMNILSNGDVTLCKECVFDNVIGNAFTQNLDEIWNKTTDYVKAHISGKYEGLCKNCDEYYTFNF